MVEQYLFEFFSERTAPVSAITLVILLSIIAERSLSNLNSRDLQSYLGLSGASKALFYFLLLLWGALFSFLFVGLLILITDIIRPGIPRNDAEQAIWRFTLTKVTASTAVMVALIALPFTLVRLSFLSRQTSAQESGILVDRMNSANEALGSTITSEGVAVPNLAVRVGAIIALEKIADDVVAERQNILRMLAFYIFERASNSAPPAGQKKGLPSDIQAALDACKQIVDHLKKDGLLENEQIIDLRGAGFGNWRLLNSCFSNSLLNVVDFTKSGLYGAMFEHCHLRAIRAVGTRFSNVDFNYCTLRDWETGKNTALVNCSFRGTALYRLDFQKVKIDGTDFSSAYADRSVQLPNGIRRPRHWSKKNLAEERFRMALKRWRRWEEAGRSGSYT
jgi:uncharacterized protein YjbI with pentapeptide repeats